MEAEEKFISSLEKAKQELKTADHLIYMTFPLIKENRLLLKILEKIYSSLINIINAILQYEYIYKRIRLYNNARDNFNTFKSIAQRYSITPQELEKIIEIMSLAEKHKKSPFEFVKKDKIIIMSDSLKTETLTLERVKSFLINTKEFLKKTELSINKVQRKI